MRYSIDHKAQTRVRVLREAAREIRAKGPAGIALGDVMKRAGLTHGGFYAHFASKDALVGEAIAAMFEDARGWSRAFDGTNDPRAALRAYVDFYLSAAHRDARDRGCPLPALSGDIARLDATTRARFAVGVDTLSRRLSTALAAIGVADAQADASAMLSQLVGAVVLARAIDRPASDAVLANARAALIERYGLEQDA